MQGIFRSSQIPVAGDIWRCVLERAFVTVDRHKFSHPDGQQSCENLARTMPYTLLGKNNEQRMLRHCEK